jgi:hypothetical protein
LVFFNLIKIMLNQHAFIRHDIFILIRHKPYKLTYAQTKL